MIKEATAIYLGDILSKRRSLPVGSRQGVPHTGVSPLLPRRLAATGLDVDRRLLRLCPLFLLLLVFLLVRCRCVLLAGSVLPGGEADACVVLALDLPLVVVEVGRGDRGGEW